MAFDIQKSGYYNSLSRQITQNIGKEQSALGIRNMQLDYVLTQSSAKTINRNKLLSYSAQEYAPFSLMGTLVLDLIVMLQSPVDINEALCAVVAVEKELYACPSLFKLKGYEKAENFHIFFFFNITDGV